jgi:hypothetical protein
MKRSIRFAFVLFIVLLSPANFEAPASADVTTQAGVLNCSVASGFGWIIGSSRTIDCEYHPMNGPNEKYSGTLAKMGIDVGYLAPVQLVWAVVAPSKMPSTGALAGNYVGATMQAALILGVGVNAMSGGFRKSVALQPISIEGDAGLYIGAGVSSMTLKFEESDASMAALNAADSH